MPFQKQVNVQQAPGVAGGFCSKNPRFTVIAGQGAFTAGPVLNVATFAWATPALDNDGSPGVANSYGSGPVTGFVGRNQQGLLTVYLEEASMQIPEGFGTTLYSGGDFWVVNNGTTEAQFGQIAYANFTNGLVSFAVSGSPAQSFSGNASIAAETLSVVGGIQGDVLTVTTVNSGNVWPGAAVSGTGVSSGTKIVSQIDGINGYTGDYYVSIGDQATAANASISGTYGLLTVNSVSSGSISVGSVLSGAGGGNAVATGTTVSALLTSTGGAGTAVVTPSQNVSNSVVTAVGTVQTKWTAMSSGSVGSLIKISDHQLG